MSAGVDSVLLAVAVLFAGWAIGAGLVSAGWSLGRPRPVRRDETLDVLRRLVDDGRLQEQRREYAMSGNASADLSRVAAMLDGKARTDELVRLAVEQLDAVRRQLDTGRKL